jgi:hypothetical protein
VEDLLFQAHSSAGSPLLGGTTAGRPQQKRTLLLASPRLANNTPTTQVPRAATTPGTPTGGSLGLLTRELAIALEEALALVLAQDARFLDTRLEAAHQLIDRLVLANGYLH